MNQNRVMPWYGANTGNAELIGKLLAGVAWVGIPFCGGMSELRWIKARSIVVNDKHEHVINLCHVLRNDLLRADLVMRLEQTAFHPLELQQAQRLAAYYKAEVHGMGEVEYAHAYFVSQWMGRSGNAGTDKEFTGKIPIRTNANGGDSCKRFRSATESLDEWAAIMRPCNFSCLDFREWFEQYDGDTEEHGYYIDAPWVEEGDRYIHKVAPKCHEDLAKLLRRYQLAKVVVRYGDHPMIRELYDGWEFQKAPTRNQGNNKVDEVLITRPSAASSISQEQVA